MKKPIESLWLKIDTVSRNAWIAEDVLGWKRVQPPKWDYNGSLPEQGEVLASPDFSDESFEWPPKGIIPFTYFVAGHESYSENMDAAMKLVDAIKHKFNFSLSWNSELGLWVANASPIFSKKAGFSSKSKSASEAICLTVLKAVNSTKKNPNIC